MRRDHHARLWLQEEFKKRNTRNPLFSLRAFARQLEMTPGRLSEVLSGRRPITPRMVAKVCDRLDAKPTERKRLLASLGEGGPVAGRYSLIAEDRFELIASWEHYAILTLTETQDFSSDPAWIAARLKVSPVRVRSAVERLLRVGLLRRNESGALEPSEPNVTTTEDVPSTALKRAHEQDLKRAIRSLYDVPVEERDISSITLAVDVTRIPLAKKMIRDFRRKLAAALEVGERTEVYNLNLQLVPVTRKD